jgi:hypothetical protein
MLGVAGLYALLARLDWRHLAWAAGLLVLAAAPAGVLFLLWHGLVPKGGNPGSCGFCAAGGGEAGAHGLLSAQTLELTLAAFAFYGSIVFAPEVLELIAERRGSLRVWTKSSGPWIYAGLAAAALGVLLLVIWPARPGPVGHSAGLLWNAAHRLPAWHGSSLVFWVLVPLAGVVFVSRLRVSNRPGLLATFFGCFLLGALAIRLPWQKYVDPFALLALMVTVRGFELTGFRRLLGVVALAAGSVAYAVSLAA